MAKYAELPLYKESFDILLEIFRFTKGKTLTIHAPDWNSLSFWEDLEKFVVLFFVSVTSDAVPTGDETVIPVK